MIQAYVKFFFFFNCYNCFYVFFFKFVDENSIVLEVVTAVMLRPNMRSSPEGPTGPRRIKSLGDRSRSARPPDAGLEYSPLR